MVLPGNSPCHRMTGGLNQAGQPFRLPEAPPKTEENNYEKKHPVPVRVSRDDGF
jgi:hypothetical protein